MREPRNFLVVADDSERLFLIAATLHRNFPNSVVQTCRESDAAIEVAKTHALDAIIAQRSSDLDELALLRQLRGVTKVPILAMADDDAEAATLAAGASKHLNVDRWLLAGRAVADLIGARKK